MANAPMRIKAASFYVKGAKVGTAEGGDFSIASNDEDHITDEGWSVSDGTPTCKMTINVIVPVDGKTKRLAQALLDKEYISVQVGVVDGAVFSATMRATDASYTIDNKTGSLKGKFDFRGGEPEIVS